MQILLHATHASVDAHIVVVQDDEQVVWCTADIVKSLEGKTAAHAAVTNDGHHFAILLG